MKSVKSLKSLEARVGDEPWLVSNPVAILQTRLLREGSAGMVVERRRARDLLTNGYELSRHYLDNLGIAVTAETPVRRHGIVGLVLGRDRAGRPHAWADRLHAEPAARWCGRRGLPFEPLDLLGVLLSLLRARPDDELLHSVPEAKAFALQDELDEEEITGPSMTVAGALAVLDAATGHARAELAAVASFVQLEAGAQPTGDAGTSAKLVHVEGEGPKLEAFERECGRGSLCLVAPGSALSKKELHRSFERVWIVDSLRGLGGRLEAEGLLEDFARPKSLGLREIDRVEALLGGLRKDEFMVRRALDLAARLKAAVRAEGPGPDVPASRVRRALAHSAQPLRFEAVQCDAVLAAEAVLQRASEAPELAPHSELCAASIELAAAHYVEYRFDRMVAQMEPWRARLAEDPQLVNAYTRVRVLGNLARGLATRAVADGSAPVWQPLFEQALKLQALTDASKLSLTRGFYVGALLAAGKLDAAEEQLLLAEGELARSDYAGNLSLWFLRFDRADLARRRGELWDDPEMEREGVVREGQFGRAMGYYFQATARQQGRTRDDAAARFQRAAEYFKSGGPHEKSGQWVFVALCELGAAERRGDAAAWRAARVALDAFLAHDFAAGIREWYGELLPALPSDFQAQLAFDGPAGASGDPGASLERLYSRDPYLLGIAPHKGVTAS